MSNKRRQRRTPPGNNSLVGKAADQGGAAFTGSGVKPLSSMQRAVAEATASQLAQANAAGFRSGDVQIPQHISRITASRPRINLPTGARPGDPALRDALTRPFAGTRVEGMRPVSSGPPLRPDEVLDMHSRLTEAMRVPSDKQVTYLDGFIESVFRRAREEGGVVYEAQAWEYLFYPALDGASFAKVLWRQLNRGRTYQVASRMMDAVTDAYAKARPYMDSMSEKDLPGEAGFAWFDKPLAFTDSHGKTVKQRAISWSAQTVRYASGDDMARGVPDTPLLPGSEGLSLKEWEQRRTTTVTAYPGVRITSWCHVDDPDDYWAADVMDEIRQLGSMNMIMSHSVIVPFGQRFVSQLAGGESPDEVTGDDVARWVLMLFRFFNDEITVTSRPRIPRPVQRRAQKSLKHGEVHVVMLRRAHAISTEQAIHRIVNWSCRWPVEGFWRHIDSYEAELDDGKPRRHHAVPDEMRTHCMTCRARITWVHPHIRGPSWLPIKESKQIYKLAR